MLHAIGCLLLLVSIATGLVPSSPFQTLKIAQVVDPRDGSTGSATAGLGKASLCVILPQLGDFDTAEYCEQLIACEKEMAEAQLDWRIIGIGDVNSAKKFCKFTSLPLERLRMVQDSSLHESLQLANGPDWDVPFDFFPETVFGLNTRAWLNYMAMCAGLYAPGTLREILRGYVGDKTAPERLAEDEEVRAAPVVITGTKRVKLGPFIEYDNLWASESGYQRPVELATVRLRNMAEVLSNWKEYVPDDRHLAWRGATYLFDGEDLEYEHRTPGVLTYSATPSRPLSFLEPRIGKKALNPLGFSDPRGM